MSEAPYPDEIPLLLPPVLQNLLENDCVEITQKKKLVVLPSSFTVESILKQYFDFIRTQNEDSAISYSLLIEVLDGIKIYFNHTLHDHLLYHEEKSQHQRLVLDDSSSGSPVLSNGISPDEAMGDNETATDHSSGVSVVSKRDPSTVYGAIHLLRLFAKLPQFLSYARVPANHVYVLHYHFKDFFSYLSANINLFDKYTER